MSDKFNIEIEFDTGHLIINLWDENWDLRGVGKVPLNELKFHMDRAAEVNPYNGWVGDPE